uniref:Uncharacterized protein n=1 Tax=Moniliophthora roreri TaxID=221103 RepID=A0A0W0FSR1_MONRR
MKSTFNHVQGNQVNINLNTGWAVVKRTKYDQFTAVMYKGKDAKWFWKKEFESFSHTRNPLVTQLFGINQLDIPMLIFHDELIPYANFFNKESFWVNIYIKHLMVSPNLHSRLNLLN